MFKIFLGILLIFLAVAVIIAALFSYRFGGYRFGMMYAYPAMWLLGPLFMVLSLILLFLFIYWVINAVAAHEDNYTNMNDKEYKDALEILNLRYAKGEITQEQYVKMKEDILRK